MQLRLWGMSVATVDLFAKIKAEKLAGMDVFYHFCGKPIGMISYRPVRKTE